MNRVQIVLQGIGTINCEGSVDVETLTQQALVIYRVMVPPDEEEPKPITQTTNADVKHPVAVGFRVN